MLCACLSRLHPAVRRSRPNGRLSTAIHRIIHEFVHLSPLHLTVPSSTPFATYGECRYSGAARAADSADREGADRWHIGFRNPSIVLTVDRARFELEQRPRQ